MVEVAVLPLDLLYYIVLYPIRTACCLSGSLSERLVTPTVLCFAKMRVLLGVSKAANDNEVSETVQRGSNQPT